MSDEQLQQAIKQGYLIRHPRKVVARDTYLRMRRLSPSVTHRYFDYCLHQHLPLITATHKTNAEYASVEIDFATTRGHRLSREGSERLASLFRRFDDYPPGRKRPYEIVGEGRSYTRAERIRVSQLSELMPQIVELVRECTVPDPHHGA